MLTKETEPLAPESSPVSATPLPLQKAIGSGQGRSHGTSRSEPFDRWFRYPAGFASDYVSHLLEQLNLEARSLIVDPFAGSAVTGTSARSLGHSFVGIEAHPAIAELGNLKLGTPPSEPRLMLKTAQQLIDASIDVGSDYGAPETDLITRSFTHEVLGQLTSLRNLIQSGAAGEWEIYAKWALLGTLRDVACVRVGWPYQNPSKERKARFTDPRARFKHRMETMCNDLARLEVTSPERASRLTVVHGDSARAESWKEIAPGSVNGCVSSPPYLNNFDYADATRLEMYFWGDARSWYELCKNVRGKMLTATTQQSSTGAAKTAAERLKGFGPVAAEIEVITEKLMSERASRKRGKEYDRVVPDYFAAIGDVLSNLAVSMAPGASAVWLVGDSAPYGTYIDTPKIISRLAEHCGFRTLQDTILRQRGKRWSANATRHSVELSERLILLVRE